MGTNIRMEAVLKLKTPQVPQTSERVLQPVQFNCRDWEGASAEIRSKWSLEAHESTFHI
jgi:hypothetical protein